MQEAGFQATNAFTECRFACASGKCLELGSLVCNQQNDCGDNSDEENCLLVTEHPPPGVFHSELEFAQIVVVVVVVAVMVVVVVCLLNHYKVSTRSFIHRPSPSRRQDEALQPEGCLWPANSSMPRQGASEILFAPRARDRFAGPSFLPRDRFGRFQPTFPRAPPEIDLPPTISLSDGEEPPPYQGPCALQLRDPEQQRELNRESVRAPPNRTVFDSALPGAPLRAGGPRPPSSHAGVSAATCSSRGRMDGPPPAYSELLPAPGAPGRDRKPGDLV
ncbi:low-density lipoprotein receptor class A domain-containing protein 4 isoform X2 [Choloepus didactylus]|uniref:low-density lipoprotein receptor class A domain-containing protein 4 isoform X2 n=1 Tax=Choloepus didactylus TaxID=27675 RepID=UPI00189EAF21|nr:low-density lipoprotein receptor class A domain-containing protein 4 isoform X2 [Choloepus didactylus]XP_037661506.1 low-density lipoprotein receptor class A domain-containing protein 4 isoform X2 [Choloepus didactylus]XP_037661507.1 low-density lipoprotein receptor class A domain-containing protein 4 isoform X2 [Choloepus didactylus]